MAFDEDTRIIPIIVPRNYLNLYNLALHKPESAETLRRLMSLVQMDIMMRGNGRVEQYKGNIVGFSNRLNTFSSPNPSWTGPTRTFAPGKRS